MSTFLSNVNEQLINLDKNIIEKLNTFINETVKTNENNYKELSTIINTIQEEKKSIEKTKKKYFESSKEITDLELKLAKKEINSKPKKDDKPNENAPAESRRSSEPESDNVPVRSDFVPENGFPDAPMMPGDVKIDGAQGGELQRPRPSRERPKL